MIEILIGVLLVIIVVLAITLFVVALRLMAERRDRGGYNLEYPADFHASQADQDQRDRFDQEGIGKSYK